MVTEAINNKEKEEKASAQTEEEKKTQSKINSNRELLNLIHKNSTMGLISLKKTICINRDAKFEEVLENQLKGYREIFEKTKELLIKNGFEETSPGFCTKMCVMMSLNMQTMWNDTPSKLAELTLMGNCLGWIKALKNKRKYMDAEPDILQLVEDYIQMLERHIQELKIYL